MNEAFNPVELSFVTKKAIISTVNKVIIIVVINAQSDKVFERRNGILNSRPIKTISIYTTIISFI